MTDRPNPVASGLPEERPIPHAMTRLIRRRLHATLAATLASLTAPLAAAQVAPSPTAPPRAPATPKTPPASDRMQLPITPGPMGYDRLRADLAGRIADEARRETFSDELARLWDRYNLAWAAIEKREIGLARGAVSQMRSSRTINADVLRARYADALVAVDRTDAAFFASIEAAMPVEARPALDALRRARARAIAGHGLAPYLALSVPVRWNDPIAWLNACETRIPFEAYAAYDATTCDIAVRLCAPRRRFETDLLVQGTSRERIEAIAPTLATDYLPAVRSAVAESIAAVEALRGSVPDEDVARIHVARITDLYPDIPRPERPFDLFAYPDDDGKRDLWLAERARLSIADEAILRRYEARALETLASRAIWDRAAYDMRQAVAAPFKAERTALHDEANERMRLLLSLPTAPEDAGDPGTSGAP